MKTSRATRTQLYGIATLGSLAALYFYYRTRQFAQDNISVRDHDTVQRPFSAINRRMKLSPEREFDEAQAELEWIWQELYQALRENFPERDVHSQDTIASYHAPSGTTGSYGMFARIINNTPSLFAYMGYRNINPGHIDHCMTVGSLRFPIKSRKG